MSAKMRKWCYIGYMLDMDREKVCFFTLSNFLSYFKYRQEKRNIIHTRWANNKNNYKMWGRKLVHTTYALIYKKYLNTQQKINV